MINLLGHILVENGLIGGDAVASAVEESRSAGLRLGEYLVGKGRVTDVDVARSLATQFRLPYAETVSESDVENLLREYPVAVFKEENCLPLSVNDHTMAVAVSDPLDLDIVAAIQDETGFLVEVHVAAPGAISKVRERLFEGESSLNRLAGSLTKEYEKDARSGAAELPVEEMRKKTESRPVVRLVSLLFDEAIRLRASDIHVEPGEHGAVVRLRIDGLLVRHTELTRLMYLPVISRMKILADLDIAEKRVPQDGRIRYSFQSKDFDFRVSTLPTHFGEKVVIRLLKHDQSLLEVANLGLPSRDLTHLMELIEKPQGMVFVTGPTGSGKSSTLFACLNGIRRKAINITTIENPIEYKLDGINQVQINEKAGVTFATTLRSILRQDPDVILVGEIRDKETAEIAIQASQTGHLVFSTLHTNDAISAITRLRDLGIPGFLVGSSMLGILAQRLVRILCPHCKRADPVPSELKSRWKTLMGDLPMPDGLRPVGCDKCNNLGYRGRTGVFELIVIDETIRTMITENAPENDIRKTCRSLGMKALVINGIEKIAEGITTPEELLRVVLVEDIASMSPPPGGGQSVTPL